MEGGAYRDHNLLAGLDDGHESVVPQRHETLCPHTHTHTRARTHIMNAM